MFDKITHLFSKNEVTAGTLRMDLGNGFYCTYQERPNGFGGYHAVDICLKNERKRDFCRKITQSDGSFVSFPGIVHGDWEKKLDMVFCPVARFQNGLSPFKDGKAEFRWVLQPDGRYFADEDGFGAENYVEIWLHSYIDENGCFTEPFSYCKDF